MKSHAFFPVLAITAFALISTSSVTAQSKPPVPPPLPHTMPQMPPMGKTDMAAIMSGPHHVLAMAYLRNVETFAKVLNTQATGGSPLDAKLAREAVEQIDESFEEMGEHRDAHMKAMSEEMRAHMAMMMKDMAPHLSMLEAAIRALKEDVRPAQPDAAKVASHSADILKHLGDMAKMHDDPIGK